MLRLTTPLAIANGDRFELRDDRHGFRFPLAFAEISQTPDRTGARAHVVEREFAGALRDRSIALWFVDATGGERFLGCVTDALEPAHDAPACPWIVVGPATFVDGSAVAQLARGGPHGFIGAAFGKAVTDAFAARAAKFAEEKIRARAIEAARCSVDAWDRKK